MVPSRLVTAEGTARPAPTHGRPAAAISRAATPAISAIALAGSPAMARVDDCAAMIRAPSPMTATSNPSGCNCAASATGPAGSTDSRCEGRPCCPVLRWAASSTWIRPSSCSSLTVAPAVARVTPSAVVSTERVGARPVWMSISAWPIMFYPYFVQMLNKIAHPGLAERRRPSLHALRVAVTVFFALDGYLFASWAVRVPAVKAQVGASPAALGLALLGLSAGSIATMTASGALCRRFGSRAVTVAAATMLSVTLVLPALARSAVELGLALAAFGIAYGGLNVAMNSVAVDLVAALRRPVMPSFHAAWSFGGLAGASVGGLLAPHLSPRADLAL